MFLAPNTGIKRFLVSCRLPFDALRQKRQFKIPIRPGAEPFSAEGYHLMDALVM
jgi:hypothetical protein